MTGQELKILFRNDKAYLTTDKSLTFEQLGLPNIAKKFKESAFWIIEVLSHIESEKRIFCEITSYQIGETEFGHNQKWLADKLSELQIVTFRSIDTNGLLKTLAGNVSVVRQPSRISIKETFYVSFKNVRFKPGGISFDKKFKRHRKTIEITISNYDIREEFDAIKNYFANVLKTKKIEVSVNIKISDHEVTSIEAKSPEIDKINKRLIDDVKFEFIKSTTKKKLNVEIDKTMFTMEEYFDSFADENFKSNTFYSNDKELFEDLLAISNTKHYKHLRFLSSKHSHEIMKLRFIHKPFSFIFLIQGDRKYHIVWETLDTEEATYVWHIDKDISILRMTLKKIDGIIKSIKAQGKTAYINSSDDSFRRVYHDYSELVEGFKKWKGELESILT